MTVRFDPVAAAPEQMKAWFAASNQIIAGLEPTLAELIEIRVSQINGCANCINMHAYSAREKGETEQRVYLLAAWREAPCYTARERAALGWAEALTRLAEAHTHEAAYKDLAAHFTPEEQAKLTLLITLTNGWNRIALGCGGFMDPAAARAAAQKSAA